MSKYKIKWILKIWIEDRFSNVFSGNGRDFRSRRRDSNQGWRWSSLVSNCPSCLQGREGLNGSWCSSRENLFQTITDISTVVNLKQKYLWKTNSVETFLWYKLKTWNCQNALFLDYQCSQEIPYPTWKSSRTRIFHGRIYFRFRKAEIPVTHVPEFSLKTPESKHSLQFAFSTGLTIVVMFHNNLNNCRRLIKSGPYTSEIHFGSFSFEVYLLIPVNVSITIQWSRWSYTKWAIDVNTTNKCRQNL